jgi:hypothetical protein
MEVVNDSFGSYFSNADEQRYWEAYSKGGKKCCDKKVISKARSVGKEMIKVPLLL